MAIAKTASVTIAEMREFASFTAAEQRYIRRSLDIGLGRCDAFRVWGRNARENAAIRSQYVAYQELKALRHAIPNETGFDAVEGFIGKLTRVAAFDLAQERIACSGPRHGPGFRAPSAPPPRCRRSSPSAASCCSSP